MPTIVHPQMTDLHKISARNPLKELKAEGRQKNLEKVSKFSHTTNSTYPDKALFMYVALLLHQKCLKNEKNSQFPVDQSALSEHFQTTQKINPKVQAKK